MITAVGQLEHALTKLREANIEKNSELVRLRNILHENNINFALDASISDARINTSLQHLSGLKMISMQRRERQSLALMEKIHT